MKTLYVSDLDGTLLSGDGKLSQNAMKELNRMIDEDKIEFTIATARTWSSGETILKGLRISLPIVLLNGVIIYDYQKEKIVKMCEIQRQAMARVLEILRRMEIPFFAYIVKAENVETFFETDESMFMREFMQERIEKYGKKFYKSNDIGCITDPLIYLTMYGQYDQLLPVSRLVQVIGGVTCCLYTDTYKKDRWYLEIFSSDATKGAGVRYIREEYGFDKVVSFGDNLNDIPLFKASDVAVAVSNANPELIERADEITLSNEEDGVVEWIRRNNKIVGLSNMCYTERKKFLRKSLGESQAKGRIGKLL